MMTPRRSAAVMIAVAAVICPLMLSGAVQATAGTQMPPNAAAVTGTWGAAQKVPGAIALNGGGQAQVQSVSCASAGNCSAGGYYTDRSGHHQVFVVSQVNGTWHNAIEVPGTATLNRGGNANIFSVSCASAGNCSAGGYYTTDAFGHTQAFLVSQVKGTWRTAIKVPGTAALNVHGNAEVNSVSCPSAGNCTAGGYYKDGSYHYQAFVVSEVNGTWRTAKELLGTVALNKGGNAGVTSVSCASAGNCSAGGSYVGSSPGSLPFVASEVNGTWRSARAVPGAAALTDGGALITSVSCSAAGNCSAGGAYQDSSGHEQAFVVNQVAGTWHSATQVPGTASLNTGGSAYIYSLSCGSAGNCSAVGSYFTSYLHAFVANEVNGVWGTAIELPGTAALNLGKTAYAISVSCASAGNCTAGGTYTDSAEHMQAFVASEVNGTWRTATQLPGTGALNPGGHAFVESVSCTSAGKCSAGGGYTGSARNRQAFVATQS
ncbi:MAG TPA: hypothetical protein VHJ18_20185 [Streptosporangiaceae bacterium]|nr:hypothetical protein [Streptosporangiaceae bacterium]